MIKKNQELLILYLNEVIVANDLSQKDIAEKLNIADSYVSSLRAGFRPVSKKVVRNLEKIHSISLDEFEKKLSESSFAHILKRIKEDPLILNAIKSSLSRHK